MNNQQKSLFQKINNYTFDEPDVNFTFAQRLAKENNWHIEYTNRVIEEYRKFTFLAIVAGHIVSPPKPIDQAWHLHLTYTHSYWDDFCPHVLGKNLHHQPSKGGNLESQKYDALYSQTLDSYQNFFGDSPPQDIWLSPENCCQENISFKRVNTKENWIIPKPILPRAITNIVKKIKATVKKQSIAITSVCLVLLILLGSASPGLANNTNFYWDFLNVTLDLQDNGDLLVTEEQKYVFTGTHSPKHHRFIKLDVVKAIEDVQVFEDDQLLPIKTAIYGDEFWIEWQESLDNNSTHIFTLKYRAIGATINNNGENRLTWKVIFPKRNAVINNSEVTINLPEILAGKVNALHYFGGIHQNKLIDSKTIKFTSLKSFRPGEQSSISISFLGNNLLNLRPIEHPSYSSHEQLSDNSQTMFMMCFGFLFLFIILIAIVQFNTDEDDSEGSCSSCSSCSSGCSSCSSGCGGGD